MFRRWGNDDDDVRIIRLTECLCAKQEAESGVGQRREWLQGLLRRLECSEISFSGRPSGIKSAAYRKKSLPRSGNVNDMFQRDAEAQPLLIITVG